MSCKDKLTLAIILGVAAGIAVPIGCLFAGAFFYDRTLGRMIRR